MRRWEGNIYIDLKGIVCDIVDLICMVLGHIGTELTSTLFHIQVDSGGKIIILGSVILGLILNDYRDRVVFISSPNCGFCFVCGWKNSEGYKRKLGARDELLLRVLDAAARMKNMKIN